ncbi:hypothetical protein KKA83_01760, partial [Patescibacteria group bacterium]|nr:hypothetical protein [Patescibacteria group bacterium]
KIKLLRKLIFNFKNMEEASQLSKATVKKIVVKKLGKSKKSKVKSQKLEVKSEKAKVKSKKLKSKSKVIHVKNFNKIVSPEAEQFLEEDFIEDVEVVEKIKPNAVVKQGSAIFDKVKDELEDIFDDKIISHPIASHGKLSHATKINDNKKIKPINIYKKIAASFIFLTVLLVATIFYFSFVNVSIVLIPNQEDVSNSLTLDVYDQQKNPVLNSSVILGMVNQVEVKESKTYQASNKEVLGQEVVGKVTIVNDYNKDQPLMATTRLLSSDNKLFRIKNTVVAPAGGQVEAEVYADEPSREMAIGPTKFTIPGLWAGMQDKIYGESAVAMEYKEKVKITIQQSDIDQAVNDLKTVLIAKTKEQVHNDFKDYDRVIYEIDNNSITQQLDGKVGDEKKEFTLNIKDMVTVVAFADEKVFQLAKQKLASDLPNDKELANFSKKDIVYNLSSFDLKQGTAITNISFTGKMVLKKNAEIIDRKKLLGLTNEQLTQYLGSIPEIAGYEIKFSPSFIKKVPNLVDRIKVEVKE